MKTEQRCDKIDAFPHLHCFCMYEGLRGWHKQSMRSHFRLPEMLGVRLVVHTFKRSMHSNLLWNVKITSSLTGQGHAVQKACVVGRRDAWIIHRTKVFESHIVFKTKKHKAAMFHMSLWSRLAGLLNVRHVTETDWNWQDNKAHNMKRGVCLYLCQSWLLRWFIWWKTTLRLNLASQVTGWVAGDTYQATDYVQEASHILKDKNKKQFC